MRNKVFWIWALAIVWVLSIPGAASASGCAGPGVDAFEILVDLSGSLGGDHVRQVSLLTLINGMVPDGKFTAALRSFYQYPRGDGSASRLEWGIGPYDRDGFGKAIARLTHCQALTPLGPALADTGGDLVQMTGKRALVVVSDFRWSRVFGNPAVQAAALRAKHPDLRVFAVRFSSGKEELKTARAVAEAGGGRVYDGNLLLSDPSALRAMVGDVFSLGLGDCPAVTHISLDLEFDPGRAEVKPSHYDRLQKAADYLKRFPHTTAVVEGHTDDRGSSGDNLALSTRRARSARLYLVEEMGIDADRLKAVGYGSSQPVKDNTTENGRRQNRRVDVIISGAFQAE